MDALIGAIRSLLELSRDRHFKVLEQLEHIKEKVNHMSQQADTLVAGFGTLSSAFATFAQDTTTALADIAAKQGDPADTAKIQSVIDGMNTLATTVADLDAKVKAADPGAGGTTGGTPVA